MKRITILTSLFLFCLCVMSFADNPPPPTNEDCATAESLTVLTQITCGATSGTTIDAADANPDPSCDTGGGNKDVWYKFTMPSEGEIEIVFTMDPAGPLEFALYKGSCGSLTEILCKASNNLTNHHFDGEEGGAEYFLQIWNDSGKERNFTVCILGPPSNDDCSGSVPTLTVQNDGNCAGNETQGTNRVAQTGGTDNCDNTSPNLDVWYQFVAPDEGVVDVALTLGTSPGLDLAIYETCASSEPFFCGINFSSARVATLVPGNTYYVRIWADQFADTGTFDICLEKVTAVQGNDFCNNPTALTVYANGNCTGNYTSGSTENAIIGGDMSCDPGGDNLDVWYNFTAPAGEEALINITEGSGVEIEVVAYSTCGGTELFCHSSPNGKTIAGLTSGNNYLVQVFSDSGLDGSFSICLEVPPAPPANDECSNAEALTLGNSTSGTTLYAADNGVPSCDNSGVNRDVWYSFVAPGTGAVLLDFTPAMNVTLEAAVYDACGGNEVFCDNTPDDETVQGLTSGNTYYLKIWSDNGLEGTFDFTVSQTTAVPIELTYFEGKSLTDHNLLEWVTASEINTEIFQIQYSKDGIQSWEIIGEVSARGWSDEPIQYSFQDKLPSVLSFYRLKIIDFDGHFNFSETIVIERESAPGIQTVYPNPFSDNLVIEYYSNDFTELPVCLINVNGQTVFYQEFWAETGSQKLEIETENIQPGILFLRVGKAQIGRLIMKK